jgi:hypothetical protein
MLVRSNKREMNTPFEELILRPDRLKHLGLLVLALAFVAVGIWMIGRGDPTGWLSTGFFGLCAGVFAANLLPQASYLKLTRDGFEFVTLFRHQQLRWADVSGFRAARVAGRKMVLMDLNNDALMQTATAKRLAAVSLAIAGAAAALPDTYGMTAEALAEVLNDWHRRHQSLT